MPKPSESPDGESAASVPASATGPRTGYVICFTARSGSNFLCELLASTGQLGHPQEYFNPEGWRESGTGGYPDDPDGQVAWILSHAVSPNGVYGLKAAAAQIDRLNAYPWTGKLPGLCYVYLSRRDILGQAISLARAIQTGAWHSGASNDRPARFDAGAVQNCLRLIARDEARWRMYFARNAIAPLAIDYEDLIADPATAVGRIAQHVGVTDAVRVEPGQLRLSKQRDGESETWRRQFLATAGDRNRVDELERGFAARAIAAARRLMRRG